jgi:hypothetical protein
MEGRKERKKRTKERYMYNSTIKKNEILSFAQKWMELEIII